MKFALVSFRITTVRLTTTSSWIGLRFVPHFATNATSSTSAPSVAHRRSCWNPHRRPGRSLAPDVLFHRHFLCILLLLLLLLLLFFFFFRSVQLNPIATVTTRVSITWRQLICKLHANEPKYLAISCGCNFPSFSSSADINNQVTNQPLKYYSRFIQSRLSSLC